VRRETKTTKAKDKHMKKKQMYVGLDVHKDTITISIAEGGRRGETRHYGKISSDLRTVENVLRKIRGEDGELHVVYEAGPTGFVLWRRLTALKIDCIIVAPSKVPTEKGKRQKTDRRDAEQLARLHRSGDLRGIYIPDEADEAIRDLTRARSDVVDDVRRAKLRLKSFLLRQGFHYTGKANWSEKHRRYLRELKLPVPSLKAVLEEYLLMIDQAEKRLSNIDDLLAVQVRGWRMFPAVEALMCMRGIQLTAATVLIAEIGDIHRFRHPRQLMGFLGLVPLEKTTGNTRRIGSITKAGNAHARWMMIEVAQHALLPPKVSTQLSARQEGQPQPYRDLAWQVQTRLHKRGWHLLQRKVMPAKVTVALARELTGFIWAMLKMVPEPKTA
jgi:transposase